MFYIVAIITISIEFSSGIFTVSIQFSGYYIAKRIHKCWTPNPISRSAASDWQCQHIQYIVCCTSSVSK